MGASNSWKKTGAVYLYFRELRWAWKFAKSLLFSLSPLKKSLQHQQTVPPPQLLPLDYNAYTFLIRLYVPLPSTATDIRLPPASVGIHMCITFEKCHVKKSLVCIAFYFSRSCIIHFLISMNASLCKDGSRQEPFVWLLFYSSPAKLKISCIAFFRISCFMVRKAILFTVSPSYVVYHKRVIAV